jgi:hypothetical protein
VSEADALQKRRYHLLEQLSRAADEIAKIDNRLSNIQGGADGPKE